MNAPNHAHARLAGKFSLVAHKLDGSSRVLAEWFDNLIVDNGLNRIGTGSYMDQCYVGTGSTAPTNADTALEMQVASTSSIHATTSGTSTSPPYYGYSRRTFRFGVGAAAGNLTEVGVGWYSGTNMLFSRALIKDIDGNPTTVTVLSDEVLDVAYEFRNYAPPADSAPYVVTISGVDYTFVTRAASVTGNPHWVRSEEHTSELQSPLKLVCRLLLE